MLNIFNDLLPFRQIDNSDIINWYSMDQTGNGGRFVQMYTGNNAPDGDPISMTSAFPGYAYTPANGASLTNYRFENQRKLKWANSGATRFDTLGVTLDATIEFDENQNKILFNPQRALEYQAVPSGYTVRVITDGVLTLRGTAYNGTPLPGYVGVIQNGGSGMITFSPYSSVVNTDQIVCKCLSSSGSAFGGYAQIKLTLK